MRVDRSIRRSVICALIAVLATAISSPAQSAPPTAKSKSRPGARSAAAKKKAIRAGEGVADFEGFWPQFLGPGRDNKSEDTGLVDRWPSGGPKPAGMIRGLGIGFSNVSIADGVLYTMGNLAVGEGVLAFALAGGELVWKADLGAAYHNGYGDGPRSTPTIDGDYLYVLGATGELACFERQKGSPVWKKNLVRDFGAGIPSWGICESVLIDGDRLICTPGSRGATMVALDKKTGELLWKGATPQGDSMGYASPIAVDVGGVRQYVQLTARGTIGMRAEDGKFLWRDDSAANGTANCPTPVFADGMVFSASGYGAGGAMVRLSSRGDSTAANFGYKAQKFQVHHGGMVLDNGHVYAATDSGTLTCLELATGKLKWQNRCVGKGSITLADGKLVVRSEQGPVALVGASPAAYKELGRFDQPERSRSSAWTYPVVCGGKLFLRDQDRLLIYEMR